MSYEILRKNQKRFFPTTFINVLSTYLSIQVPTHKVFWKPFDYEIGIISK